MIDIIGAAFDLCGPWVGSRLGPAAIRLANIQSSLHALGFEARDLGDVTGGEPQTDEGGMRNFPPLLACVRDLRKTVLRSLQAGNFPLVLGGEHTLAMACVSAALEHHGETLALLWIDAHADINTPGTSVTGNLHGMPLAALCGLPSQTEGKVDVEWGQLLDVLTSGPALRSTHIAWYGLRDVDPAERERVRDGLAVTMHEVDRYGIEKTVNEIDAWLRRIEAQSLWVSFDVDALDPILAPGTGTAVRGGLTYREGHLFAELLAEAMAAESCPYRLAGVDVVETNPLRDTNNATAIMAVEWIDSLFGKSILGKR